jgi:hypothetical protein
VSFYVLRDNLALCTSIAVLLTLVRLLLSGTYIYLASNSSM